MVSYRRKRGLTEREITKSLSSSLLQTPVSTPRNIVSGLFLKILALTSSGIIQFNLLETSKI
jgi:hypothetical protein